jgi:Carboxypeptidase regulatory-like domain
MKTSRVVRALLFTCILLITRLWSQVATTSLRGTLSDPSGAVLPGASLILARPDTGFTAKMLSNPEGAYIFQQLAPGAYELTAESTGFATQTVGMRLLVDQPATLNLTMQVAASVSTVQAEALALNTTDASIGNAVDNETVQALPSEGRNVPDLLSLQPGVLYLSHNVNQDEDSRSGSVAGARSDQGNITLDGLDNNDQTKGYAFTGVLRSTLDSVDEFRVTTVNAGADSGRSSGAQVNVVTKGGTNRFHGSLYEYNRDTLTAANNWFNKQAELAEDDPNKPGKLIRNTFGASLGGPVRKDRLFFFANYEAQRTAENVQQILTVPTASFRAGNITYPSAAGSAITLNPSQFASMDPKCASLGTCPLGPGANPAVLSLFNAYPHGNGELAGDGYNTQSFTWSAPNPLDLGTYIARVDYSLSDRHRLFVRGTLQNDHESLPPQFPGQPPSSVDTDNSKGIGGGEVWSITPNLINNVRYGYTRQGYASRGIGDGPYVTFVTVSNPVAETRSTITDVPMHNFVDDLNWTKGKHNIQFGANYRLIHDQVSTDATSYNTAESYIGESHDGIANTGESLDPAAFGFPAVASTFDTSYSYAAMNLAGIVAWGADNYSYSVANGQGTLQPQGSMVKRNYKTNQLDYYIEDTWHALPKLSVTFGVRHMFIQTPYEVNGQQVSPTTSLHDWLQTRAQQAALGQSVQPTISFGLSGKANGGKPFWPMAKSNIGPHVGLAYSVDAHTVIRAGFGIVFDNYGLGIANVLATYGSAGLLGQNATGGEWVTVDAAPRFTSLQALPTFSDVPPPSSTIHFPYTSARGAEGAISIADDKSKTPYSYAFNLSVQRELHGGFTVETSYVGRLGRRLLQTIDFAMPLNLVDPAGGGDYFSAAANLERLAFAGTPASSIPKIAYWEDMFPDAANMGASGAGKPGYSATQNIYSLYAADPLNSSANLYAMDIFCSPGCGGQRFRYYSSQFVSLFAQSSMGTSSYNAGQVTLRHSMSHGLLTDISYTLSKSLDLGSSAERIGGHLSANYAFSQITNTFDPSQDYGVSDFDVTHLVTADWIYQLPFGRGRALGAQSNWLVNGVIGGWEFSGLTRWTSGLPFSTPVAGAWTTAVVLPSNAIPTGPIKIQKKGNVLNFTSNGQPVNPATGVGVRYPVSGEVGPRNNYRGDGYFGIDSGLHKSWQVADRQQLAFAWEIFNVSNSVRFDTNPATFQNSFNRGNFGTYGATLTQPRIQQFSLRYSF